MSLWQEARMCCVKAFTKREKKILKNLHSAIKMEKFTQHLLDVKIKFKTFCPNDIIASTGPKTHFVIWGGKHYLVEIPWNLSANISANSTVPIVEKSYNLK